MARAPSREAKTTRRPSTREDMMMADAADTDFTAAAAAEGRGGRPGGGGVVLRLCRRRSLLVQFESGLQQNERGGDASPTKKRAPNDLKISVTRDVSGVRSTVSHSARGAHPAVITRAPEISICFSQQSESLAAFSCIYTTILIRGQGAFTT